MEKLNPKENKAHKVYISHTPVMSLVMRVDERVMTYRKWITIEDLGNTKTIWKSLGKNKNKNRFTVKQALGIFSNGPIDKDKKLFRQYRKDISDWKMKSIKITMWKDMIVDGNKRSVAIYEFFKNRGMHEFKIPVYILKGVKR